MQDRVALERRWQISDPEFVFADTDIQGITPPTPVQKKQAQDTAHQGMNGVPVLDVEKITALTKDPLFVIRLDAKALTQVHPANTFLKPCAGLLVHICCIHLSARRDRTALAGNPSTQPCRASSLPRGLVP